MNTLEVVATGALVAVAAAAAVVLARLDSAISGSDAEPEEVDAEESASPPAEVPDDVRTQDTGGGSVRSKRRKRRRHGR